MVQETTAFTTTTHGSMTLRTDHGLNWLAPELSLWLETGIPPLLSGTLCTYSVVCPPKDTCFRIESHYTYQARAIHCRSASQSRLTGPHSDRRWYSYAVMGRPPSRRTTSSMAANGETILVFGGHTAEEPNKKIDTTPFLHILNCRESS